MEGTGRIERIQRGSRGWTARLLGALVALVALVPMAARADTTSPLPQGYRNDALPQPPAPPAAAGQNAPPYQQANETPDDETEAAAPAPDDYVDTDPAALDDFKQPLSPYGSWVDDPTYGTIWVPNAETVGSDFAPYQSSGHWALDESNEWMWASDYGWGYIPFHYGRWVYAGPRGWGWIPGRQYAPSWVVWRTGSYGYLGWAPMPPAYYWRGGAAVALWRVPPAPFVFCPSAYAFRGNVGAYVVRDAAGVRTAVANTRPFTAATPSIGRGAGGEVHHAPASPSLKQAGVPASSAPRTRSPADPRARAYASHASTASIHPSASVNARGASTLRGSSAASSRGSFGRGSGMRDPNAGREAPTWSRSPSHYSGAIRTPRQSTWAAHSSPTFRSPSYGGGHPGVAAPAPHPVQQAPAWHPGRSFGGSRGGGHHR